VTDADLPARSRVVQDCLRAAGLDSTIRELPDSTRTAADAASALGCDVGAIARSLVFLADDSPLLVMTSGAHRVDTDVVARHLGVQTVKQASAKQVRVVTGQPVGGVAPVGHPQPIRTLIDADLQAHATLWVAGGTPNTVMPLSFDQLVRLTGGQVVTVTPGQ